MSDHKLKVRMAYEGYDSEELDDLLERSMPPALDVSESEDEGVEESKTPPPASPPPEEFQGVYGAPTQRDANGEPVRLEAFNPAPHELRVVNRRPRFLSELPRAHYAGMLHPASWSDDSAGRNMEDEPQSLHMPLDAEAERYGRANWQLSNDTRMQLDGQDVNMYSIPFGFYDHPDNPRDGRLTNYMHHPMYAGRRTGMERYMLFRESLSRWGQSIMGRGYYVIITYRVIRYRALADNPVNDDLLSYRYTTERMQPYVESVSKNLVHTTTYENTAAGNEACRQEVSDMLDDQLDELNFQPVEDPDSESNANKLMIFINAHVRVIVPAGGCLDNPTLQSMLQKSHLFYSPEPPKSDPNLCFWMALSTSINRRAVSGTKRLRYRDGARAAKELRARAGWGPDPVSFGELPRICANLDVHLTIVDFDRRILFKSGHSYLPSHTANGHHLLVFEEEHYILPRSYASCVFMRYVCSDCQACFGTEEDYRDHVDLGDCLRCNKCGETFPTEDAQRMHDSLCMARDVELWIKPAEMTPYTADDVDVYVCDMESLALRGVQTVFAIGVLNTQTNEYKAWYSMTCLDDFCAWLDELVLARREVVRDKLRELFDDKVRKAKLDGAVRKLRYLENAHAGALTTDGRCRDCGVLTPDKPTAKQHARLRDDLLDWSSTCGAKWWARSRLDNELERDTHSLNPPVCIYAHNGGGYDWMLLFNHLLKRGQPDDVQPLLRAGRLLQLGYKHVVMFKDSVRMGLMGTLDKLAKSFQSPILKGIMPYSFFDAEDKIYGTYRPEDIDRHHFYVSAKEGDVSYRRPMTEAEHAEFFAERGGVYDAQAEILKYLESDVRALADVLHKYFECWRTFGLDTDPTCFVTISQMAYHLALSKYVPANTVARLLHCEAKLIRQALVGGRCGPVKRHAHDPKVMDVADCPCQREGVSDPVDSAGPEEDTTIHYQDVNSEYPGVMLGEPIDFSKPDSDDNVLPNLPCGLPKWFVELNSETHLKLVAGEVQNHSRVLMPMHSGQLLEHFSRLPENWCGYVCVDVRCPQTLHLPVLPERRKLAGSPAVKTMFTLWDKSEATYFYKELRLALSKGYEVTRVHWLCEFEAGLPFRNYICTMRTLKFQSDGADAEGNPIEGASLNPALRMVAKRALNDSFGKTAEKARGREFFTMKTAQIKRALRAMASGAKVNIDVLFECNERSVLRVQIDYPDAPDPPRAAPQLGCGILSCARVWLYKILDMCDPHKVIYYDTDSVIYQGPALPDWIMHPVRFGALSSEIGDDDRIACVTAAAPKLYAYVTVKANGKLAPTVKAKGINSGHNYAAAMGYDELVPRFAHVRRAGDGAEELTVAGADFDLNELETPRARQRQDELPRILPTDLHHEGLSFSILTKLIRDGGSTKTFSPQMLKTIGQSVVMQTTLRELRDNYNKRHAPRNDPAYMSYPWSNFHSDYDVQGLDHDMVEAS